MTWQLYSPGGSLARDRLNLSGTALMRLFRLSAISIGAAPAPKAAELLRALTACPQEEARHKRDENSGGQRPHEAASLLDVALSVFAWFLDAVDDQHLCGRLGRLQLQS